MGVEPTEPNPPYPSSDPFFGSQLLSDQVLSLADRQRENRETFWGARERERGKRDGGV